MKKRFVLLLAGFVILSLCACDSSRTVLSVETNNGTRRAMSYELFDGTKSYDITIPQNGTVLNVDIVSEDGTLDIAIGKKGGKDDPVYQGQAVPTSSFTVNLPEGGTYTIRLTAKNHKGSYDFTWESA